MFDALFFVYESYWSPQACPELPLLQRKLHAVGFEAEEIEEALNWLSGLAEIVNELDDVAPGKATGPTSEPAPTSSTNQRQYTAEERASLSAEGLAFIQFLESSKVLTPTTRELVIERALASGQGQLEMDELKVIVLLVFWALGEEPDALVMDELFSSSEERPQVH